MKLLSDRVLAKPLARQENKTESGIILGNNSKTEHDFEVVLVGDKAKNTKIGDVVRKFKNVSGVPHKHNGTDCIILRESSEIEFFL